MRARKLISALAERVPDAANRVNEPWRAFLLRLAAEVSDVDVERVRGRAEVVTPHALEDDRAGQHLTGVAQEELEERELGAREIDRPLPAPNLTRAEVELEVREVQDVTVLVAVRRAA